MSDTVHQDPASAPQEEASDAVEIPFLDHEPEHNKPRYFVAGNTFIGQTTEGEVRIRLAFKTKLVRAIRNAGDELDQFVALLDGIGDRATLELIDELDIFETGELVEAFFTAYEKRQQAPLGESSRSSS